MSTVWARRHRVSGVRVRVRRERRAVRARTALRFAREPVYTIDSTVAGIPSVQTWVAAGGDHSEFWEHRSSSGRQSARFNAMSEPPATAVGRGDETASLVPTSSSALAADSALRMCCGERDVVTVTRYCR